MHVLIIRLRLILSEEDYFWIDNCKFYHSRVTVLQNCSAFFVSQFLWSNLRDFHRTEYHQNAPMCIVVAAMIVSVVMTAIGCVTVAATQDHLFLGRNIFDCKILVIEF